jgi:hypothetical protein
VTIAITIRTSSAVIFAADSNLTPEEFAAKHQMSSAIARTAWPAAEPELADAVQRAPASDPKPDRFPPPSDHEGRSRKTREKNEPKSGRH